MASQALDQKKMIESEDDWPMWPILPMKRPMVTGWPGFGIIHAARLLTVWQVSMFDKIEPETTEKIEYKSIDAMLADGWVVD